MVDVESDQAVDKAEFEYVKTTTYDALTMLVLRLAHKFF